MRKFILTGILVLAAVSNIMAASAVFEETQKSAKGGDVQAQVKLGQMYFRGENVAKDDKNALRWYKAAADKDYPEAQYLVGFMYENGFGVKKDVDIASQYYIAAAAKGNSDAQFALGNIYLAKEDIANATLWFNQARGSNHALANEAADEIVRQGQRSPLQKESDDLFLRAYGDSEAMFILGEKYQYAQAIEGDAIPDYTAAIYWYKLSAQKDYIPAMLRLGNIYQAGELFIKQDKKQAFTYFEQAANQNSVPAQLETARMYRDGDGTRRDLMKAFYWYGRAGVQGNAEGDYNVGLMYEQGLGVSKNYQMAFQYYQRSADKGNIRAKFRLGRMYQLGLYVPQNNAEAFTLFKEAADLGDATAQYEVGKTYKDGLLDVPKNDVEATRYLTRAASRGNLQAKTELDFMIAQGRILPSQTMEVNGPADTGIYSDNLDGIGAMNIEPLVPFEYTASRGNALAQYQLAKMYQNGLGSLAQSNLDAFKWFLASANGGYALAQLELGVLYERAARVNKTNQEKYNVNAVNWYTKAGNQGEVHSQLALGKIYDAGVPGVSSSPKQAIVWYTKAAMQGGPVGAEAQLLLTAIEAYQAEADRLAREAQRQNASSARKPIPARARPVARPEVRAKKPAPKLTAQQLLAQKAQNGDSEAQYQMGLKLYNPKSKKNNAKTEMEAFNWFQRSAASGNDKAIYALAVMYYRGDGIKEDPKRAFALYLEAANAGNLDAQKSIYLIFANGDPKIGVTKDPIEAAKWNKVEVSLQKVEQLKPAEKIDALNVISDVMVEN
jgi:TPR repeat protein